MSKADELDHDPGSGLCRIILIEGIPSSGKTTTAKWIRDWLVLRGLSVDFSEELRPDHPIIDRSIMSQGRTPGFEKLCARQWEAFSESIGSDADNDGSIFVLEGCLFQSTLRFLLEHDHADRTPEDYFDRVQNAIRGLKPILFYLTQPDPREFLRSKMIERKGEEIVRKIAAYTETTQCARSRGWSGIDGMVEFYGYYREVCDRVLRREGSPREAIDVVTIDTSLDEWRGVLARVESRLASAFPSTRFVETIPSD